MIVITNRKIDRLGRIVLPLEIRTNLHLNASDSLAVCLDGNQIILLPNQNDCILCKTTENLTEINGRYICSACKEYINNMD